MSEMENFSSINQIQQALSTAKTIFIVLPRELNQDKIASALSLYLSFKKIGKEVSIFCSRSMIVEYSFLVGVDKIGKKPEGKNLIISFAYLEDSIEKVSYNIEKQKFNLIIQSKAGFPPLSNESVKYSYSGVHAELIFTIGAQSLENLGEIYEEDKELFEQGVLVNIDIDSKNSNFGKINLIEEGAASYSEVTVSLLSRLRLPFDVDVASNLLSGIEEATGTFSSPKTGADTFEAAASCLRAGAQRRSKMSKGAFSTTPKIEPKTEKKTPDLSIPSPDWLAPKIYKGNTLI